MNTCTCDPVCRFTDNGLTTCTSDDRVIHATTVDKFAKFILESLLYSVAYNHSPVKGLFHCVLAYIYFTESAVSIYNKKHSDKDAVMHSSRSTTFEMKVPRFRGSGTTLHKPFGLAESV